MLAACGGREPVVDEVGDLRASAQKAIDRQSVADAEAALAKLEAQAPVDRDLSEQLAELYRTRWETMKPHTVRVVESFAFEDGCQRVSADITFPDPKSLRASLTKELVRGRELYRRACDFRYAFEASAWLGDLPGYQADIAQLHREASTPTCARFTGSPTADHDTLGIQLAFADGVDVIGAIDKTLGDSPAHVCRKAVARAWLAESRGDIPEAKRLYNEVSSTLTGDDCFATASARRIALENLSTSTPPTRVIGSIALPDRTTIVRVTFQAMPPVIGRGTPAIYGNGTSIRHPWPKRDQYFYIDATIADGRYEARLPPGRWLPQVEIDPAGKWTLGPTTPCLGALETKAEIKELELPALEFISVQ